jgi:hypothetical protein
MSDYFKRHFVNPVVLMVVILGALAITVITVGETLLALFQPGDTKDRIDRPELWFALGLSILIIFGFAFLFSRPEGTLGAVDRDVAIGKRGIFEEPQPRPQASVNLGPLGTISDIADGYTLYAGNGALAEVRGLLPGGMDYGKQFRGFIYANGLAGASDELWIPVEAVMSVYPEAKIAFLAVKGDETEFFGWNTAPESMRRTPARKSSHL